jgi:hypothetical protein
MMMTNIIGSTPDDDIIITIQFSDFFFGGLSYVQKTWTRQHIAHNLKRFATFMYQVCSTTSRVAISDYRNLSYLPLSCPKLQTINHRWNLELLMWICVNFCLSFMPWNSFQPVERTALLPTLDTVFSRWTLRYRPHLTG